MNYYFILLTTFTIYSGCFCKIHPKKRFALTGVNALDNNSDTPISKESETNLRNFTNQSSNIVETDTKQPKLSNEISHSKIIVNVPKNEEEEMFFSKWKIDLIRNIKYVLTSFFNKIEKQQTDLNVVDNELDGLTNLEFKRQDIENFLKSANNGQAEGTKTVLQTTKDVVKTVGEDDKKVVTGNMSSYNTTADNVIDEDDLRPAESSQQSSNCHQDCDHRIQVLENSTTLSVVSSNTNLDIHVKTVGESVKKVVTRNIPSYNTTADNVVDEDDLRPAESSQQSSNCHQHCDHRIQVLENSTTLPEVSYNTNLDIHNEQNTLKIHEQTTVKEVEMSKNSTSRITTPTQSQLIKEETKIIVEGEAASKVDNESALPNKNKGSNFENIEIETKSVPEQKRISILVNTTHLKFIDNNTEYFFGEGSTEQTVATTNHLQNKNTGTEGKTTATLKEHENIEHYQKQNTKVIKKNGSHCISNKTRHRKRRGKQNNASQHTYSNKDGEIIQNTTKTLSLTLGSNNTSNQNPRNETLSTSVYRQNSSKHIDAIIEGPRGFFIYKDWLWKHLEAVKNGSFESNSKENFLKTPHFLSNSGGTEKSTTAASNTAFFKNISDLTIDLNKMILENENLHQIPNVEEDLPLKRHRRIKRYANKSKKTQERSKIPFDVEVPLMDDDNETILAVSSSTPSFSVEAKLSTNAVDTTKTIIVEQPSPAETEKLPPTSEKSSFETDNPLNTVHLAESEKYNFDKEELQINIIVPQMNKAEYSTFPPQKQSRFEREWNDGGGIRAKPLLLLVTVPSFIVLPLQNHGTISTTMDRTKNSMGVFILALCFLTRNGGWCCRLFSAHSASQTSVSREVQESLVTNRAKYYK